MNLNINIAEHITEILSITAISYVFTQHSFIQSIITDVLSPSKNNTISFIKDVIKRILSCPKCLTFNFSLVYFFLLNEDFTTAISLSCISCILAIILDCKLSNTNL